MSIISPFTSPQDVRWKGFQRRHHTIFLVKNIILFLFIILVIVEYPLFKSWWENGPYRPVKSWEYAPYQFWFRIGMALIPDVIVTLVSFVLILNPMHHSTYSFHPVFALVSSIAFMALWLTVSWLNPFIAVASEVDFHHRSVWEKLVFAETAFEAVLCLLWIAMLVYSSVAVDRWRIAKKIGNASIGRALGNEEGVSGESKV